MGKILGISSGADIGADSFFGVDFEPLLPSGEAKLCRFGVSAPGFGESAPPLVPILVPILFIYLLITKVVTAFFGESTPLFTGGIANAVSMSYKL